MGRKGFSLIETIICIAIIGTLAGLLVVAIQKARVTAVSIKDKNNIRQVILAIHQYTSSNSDVLPTTKDRSNRDRPMIFWLLNPYFSVPEPYWTMDPRTGMLITTVKEYTLINDHSINFDINFGHRSGPMSMGANHLCFKNSSTLFASVPDGTSNTIGLGERYYLTEKRNNTTTYFPVDVSEGFPPYKYPNERGCGTRTSLFAGAEYYDIFPITEGNPPVSRSSVPGITFQVKPSIMEADGRQLQALTLIGLSVAMMDGSVRTIRPEVSESTFWNAVTPSGGESGVLD
jgi:prepilin-type N-terminal cleavage/methylation domain-containing protein